MEPKQLVDPILLSNFIHQVINPLNGVLGTIDNLIDGTISDTESRQQKLEAVRGQLSHSIEMIRNLAFLSQLSSNQGIDSLKEKAGQVNLPKLIIDALQFFQGAAKRQHINLQLEDRKTKFIVPGHENLLKQVFMNIFDNCLKYSESNTKVLIKPYVQKATNTLIVEISSYGVGFDYSEKEKIFELGFRAESAKGLRASGSGIGLYICRRIMELAHGASIEAEHSHKTKKTIFRMRFPKYIIGEQDEDES